MLILLDMVNFHPTLILPHLNDLVRHIQTLLAEPLHVSGLGANATINVMKSKGPDIEIKKKTSLLLPVILRVLRIMLSNANSGQTHLDQIFRSQAQWELKYAPASNYNAVVLLQKRKRFCLSSWKGGAQIENSSKSVFLLEPQLAKEIISQLAFLWVGLEVSASSLSVETTATMTEMINVVYQLVSSMYASVGSEYIAFLKSAFTNFPHVSLEGLTTNSGRENDLRFRYPVIALDISLCYLVLMTNLHAPSGSTVELKKLETIALSYIYNMLSDFVSNSTPESGEIVSQSSENAKWYSPLTYLSSVECHFFELVRITVIKSITLQEGSVSAHSEHSQILVALKELVVNAIASDDFSCTSALNCKFICPAILCICKILAQDDFWQPFLSFEDHCNLDVFSHLMNLFNVVIRKCFETWLSTRNDTDLMSLETVCVVLKTFRLLQQRSNSLSIDPTLKLSFLETIDMFFVINQSESCMYKLLPHPSRIILIDIFYYAPFENFVSVTENIARRIITTMTSFDEARYFLTLLTARATDLNPKSHRLLIVEMIKLSVSRIHSTDFGTAMNLENHLDFVYLSLMSVNQSQIDMDNFIADMTIFADFIEYLVVPIIATHQHESDNDKVTDIATESSWERCYIKLATAHTIMKAMFSNYRAKGGIQAHEGCRNVHQNFLSFIESCSRIYVHAYVTFFASEIFPSDLFPTSRITNFHPYWASSDLIWSQIGDIFPWIIVCAEIDTVVSEEELLTRDTDLLETNILFRIVNVFQDVMSKFVASDLKVSRVNRYGISACLSLSCDPEKLTGVPVSSIQALIELEDTFDKNV